MGVRNVSRTVRSGTFRAGNGAVRAALALTRRYSRACGLQDATAARLSVTVEELVANLCDHATLPPEADIGLRLERGTGGTALTLTDPAPPFDPRQARPPTDLPPERGGGAGLALIEAWARIDGYATAGGRNTLQLWLPD